jgi:outer membrane protein TolC
MGNEGKTIAGLIEISLILLLNPFSLRGEEAQKPQMSFETFVKAIEENHPDSKITSQELAIAKEEERRAGLLPDPQVTIGRDRIPMGNAMRSDANEMIPEESPEWQVGLSQSVPWPGTLAAEERAAKAETDLATKNLILSSLDRRFAAIELYFRLVKSAKLVKLAQANLKVSEAFKEFAHARFKQGIGSHIDFLQTQAENAVLRMNLGALETELNNLRHHALLQMSQKQQPDTEFVLEWPADFMARGKTRGASADIVQESIAGSLNLKLAQNDAKYLSSLPSFMASGMVMQTDSGMQMYGAMVGLSIPLYSNIKRSSLSSEASVIEEKVNNELAWHEQRKKLALYQTEERIKQIEASLKALREEIIPSVKGHLDAATAEYSQGKVGVNAIIEGRRMLLNMQSEELTMMEALARANLGIEKIQTGLIDEEIDQSIPQLSLGGGPSMSGAMTSMPEASGKRSRDMRGRGAPSKRIPSGRDVESGPPQDGMQGM